MENIGFLTSIHCKKNLTVTAMSMEKAAYFALPMPVRQDASVPVPAMETADTDKSLMSLTSVSASTPERRG